MKTHLRQVLYTENAFLLAHAFGWFSPWSASPMVWQHTIDRVCVRAKPLTAHPGREGIRCLGCQSPFRDVPPINSQHGRGGTQPLLHGPLGGIQDPRNGREPMSSSCQCSCLLPPQGILPSCVPEGHLPLSCWLSQSYKSLWKLVLQVGRV